MKRSKFPFYKQFDRTDCGPTCLRMIAKHYGKIYSTEYLRDKSFITREGVSIMGIAEAAEDIGMHSLAANVNITALINDVPLPCIAYWRQRHFVVVYDVKGDSVFVADPEHGKLKYTKEEFTRGWTNTQHKTQVNNEEGLLLLLEPTPDFYQKEDSSSRKKPGFRMILPYFRPFRSYLVQLILGLVLSSILQFIFPFLTQAIVDNGIRYQNLNFVQLVLIGQVVIFLSQLSINIIRSWLLLHLGSRINIAISSDFLTKMMKLPLSFFDSKITGDIMQRVEDNRRVERFLSSQSLSIIFSFFNLLVFTILLFYYNKTIGGVFMLGSAVYVVWIYLFMKKRAELDFRRFDESAGNSSSMIQLINGMPEIKLNGSQKRRRWEWESIQIRLYNISIRTLAIAQFQGSGGNLINEMKNILITFIAATAVINGQMTLGMMLAIQYILGQLNVPLNNFLTFIQGAQDAKISLERIGEIHEIEDEDPSELSKVDSLGSSRDINISNLNFRYGAQGSPLVLDSFTVNIPEKKVTAIVGSSGSGKTTMLKLILKFYTAQEGSIKIGSIDLKNIDASFWRSKCGVVMQEGYIFTDTILKNITESDSEGMIDKVRLQEAVHVANIEEFIDKLPAGYNTRIGVQGTSGVTLSGGQKQRVLIARAIYKNPDYLFFDEATSSLDANNELKIMENLERFFVSKTVIVIAHRLSTVKNADNIIVMENGLIVEEGNHESLIRLKGKYYTLVKNQLELGN